MKRATFILAILWIVAAHAQTPATQTDPAIARGIEQLRHTRGDWHVTTEFLNPDGTVARSAKGTYHFDWVVPDRVLSGRSDIPELAQASGILFYLNDRERKVEMVSVGSEGRLWTMTGAVDGEVRTTPVVKDADGREMMLRFSRYDVTPNTFQSKMEYSNDRGATWLPGNHQTFVRATPVSQTPFDQVQAMAGLRRQIAGRENTPAEQVFTNITDYTGVSASGLLRGMDFYTRALGVDCTHCHTPGAWERDDKPAKKIAREMSARVDSVQASLAAFKNADGQAPVISCATCHRPARPTSRVKAQ